MILLNVPRQLLRRLRITNGFYNLCRCELIFLMDFIVSVYLIIKYKCCLIWLDGIINHPLRLDLKDFLWLFKNKNS